MSAASVFGIILDTIIPAAKAGYEIFKFIRERKDAGNVPLKDVPGFENWKKDAFTPSFTGFLDELRRRRKEEKEEAEVERVYKEGGP